MGEVEHPKKAVWVCSCGCEILSDGSRGKKIDVKNTKGVQYGQCRPCAEGVKNV